MKRQGQASSSSGLGRIAPCRIQIRQGATIVQSQEDDGAECQSWSNRALFNLSKEFFIVYESGRPTGLLGLAPSSNPLLRYADICLLLCPASIAVQCIAAAASFYRQEFCDVPNFFHLNLTSKEIASNEGIRNLINEPEFTCAGTFPGECSDGDCMNVYCFSEVC